MSVNKHTNLKYETVVIVRSTMVLLEVYTKSLKDKYKTTLLSKTALLFAVITGIKIVVPFLLAYRSKGM